MKNEGEVDQKHKLAVDIGLYHMKVKHRVQQPFKAEGSSGAFAAHVLQVMQELTEYLSTHRILHGLTHQTRMIHLANDSLLQCGTHGLRHKEGKQRKRERSSMSEWV